AADEAMASADDGVREAPEAASAPEPAPREPQADNGHDRAFVSPVVARIAAEHGVDPGSVTGTGHGGRVTKKDILAFVESPPAEAPAPAPAPAPAAAPPPAPAPAAAP